MPFRDHKTKHFLGRGHCSLPRPLPHTPPPSALRHPNLELALTPLISCGAASKAAASNHRGAFLHTVPRPVPFAVCKNAIGALIAVVANQTVRFLHAGNASASQRAPDNVIDVRFAREENILFGCLAVRDMALSLLMEGSRVATPFHHGWWSTSVWYQKRSENVIIEYTLKCSKLENVNSYERRLEALGLHSQHGTEGDRFKKIVTGYFVGTFRKIEKPSLFSLTCVRYVLLEFYLFT